MSDLSFCSKRGGDRRRAASVPSVLLSILALILAQSAVAADLAEVDRFLMSPTFENSFQSGDGGNLLMRDCIGSGVKCDEMQVSWKVDVNESNGELVASIQTFTTGGSGQPETLQKSLWQEIHGNFLRIQLRFLESYGFKWQIQSISPGKAQVKVAGQISEVEIRHVVIEAVNGTGMKTNIEFDICAVLPGPAQILKRVETKNFLGKMTTARTIQGVNRILPQLGD